MSIPEPRRDMPTSPRQYRFGAFSLNLDRGCLRSGGQEVSLRPKAFDVLTYLVQHHGRIVSKTELIDAVWPDAAVTDNSLAQCLLEIRRAIDDDAQLLIRTLSRRGYLFDSPVSADLEPERQVDGRNGVTESVLASVPSAPQTRRWFALLALAGVLVAALAARVWTLERRPTEVARFSISPPGRWTPPLMIALSPDGKHLAFIATDDAGVTRLGVRDLDKVEPYAIANTAGAEMPFWSPDGRFVGFRSGSLLRRVELATGTAQTIADHAAGGGAAWGRDDVVLFRSDLAAGLSRVSATGGTPVLAIPDTATTTWAWPHFLTDGEHLVLFGRSPNAGERGIYAGSIASPAVKRVLPSEIEAAFAAPGYLLTVRDERLVAYPFDEKALQVTGDAQLLAEQVLAIEGAAHAGFSVSANRVLAHSTSAMVDTELTWFDRRGKPLGSLGGPQRYAGQMPQLSPEGRRLAIARGVYSREDIWIIDLATGGSTRFTFDPARDATPLWSPDGSRIVFQSNRGDGRARLYQKSTVGSRSEELLFESNDSINLQDWSADGQYIVYMTLNARAGTGLWVLSMSGARRAVTFTETRARESQAQISPDSKWLAYTSNETGRDEVYIQSFPNAGNKQQVTTEGGVMPRWRKDMGELFFVDSRGRLNAVPVRRGPSLAVATPIPLFQTDIPFWGAAAIDWRALYAPSDDGQRFLINGRPNVDPPLTLVLNWTAALKN